MVLWSADGEHETSAGSSDDVDEIADVLLDGATKQDGEDGWASWRPRIGDGDLWRDMTTGGIVCECVADSRRSKWMCIGR